jgi:DNA-directed RNA polymerase subunit RPC12/RpoP
MSRVSCPYCGSVQVKAMSNQPKKYPRPADPIALANWQRGYDCKKCGNDFVVTPPKPKKPLGFFGKLFKWAFILLIAFMALAYFIGDDKPAKKDTPKEQSSQHEPTISSAEDPLDQEFSKEAEEAAHAYIPLETKKSIADSQDQSETLSIKTTLRAKDE